MKKKVKIQQQYTLLLEIAIEQNFSLFNCNLLRLENSLVLKMLTEWCLFLKCIVHLFGISFSELFKAVDSLFLSSVISPIPWLETALI